MYRKAFLVLLCWGALPLMASRQQIIQYKYHDGNANAYLLNTRTRQLRYLPVKPHESSSGFYDGGKPWSRTLTGAQYAQLTTLLEKALAARADHVRLRRKGSG